MEVFEAEVKYTLNKNTDYRVVLSDINNPWQDPQVYLPTSDAKGVISFLIYSEPDASYSVEITDIVAAKIVLMDSLDLVRQYASTDTILAYMQGKVNPTQAVEYERLARHMINAVVGFPFKSQYKRIEALGNNTDSLVLNERIIDVKVVWENNIAIWDEDYPTPDMERENFVVGVNPYVLIRKTWTDAFQNTLVEENRLEHHPTWPTRYSLPLFKYEYDYVIEGRFGWPVVPQDIQDATLLLINDIACGNNRYTNKYIRQWNGGGVAMSFADQVFAGTGNLIVDNILEKYKMEAIRARML